MQEGKKKIEAIILRQFLLSCLCIVASMQAVCENVIVIQQQEVAVRSLIKRRLPHDAPAFIVIIEQSKSGEDYFELENHNGKIVLRGNNGISVASALQYYLKNYVHCEFNWNVNTIQLPRPLPLINKKIRKESPYQYRYYLNYCTFNYSMSWWNWERWQKEIDWMALNGINMPLAVTGQELIWQRVYRKIGLAEKDLKDYFSGPAYLAWSRMGNLDGWGGPLPQSWINSQAALQKRILARERELGMTPVLPAFTGHVPAGFKNKFPKAKVQTTKWSGFNPVYILNPEDDWFGRIGKLFLEEQTKMFGTDHLYSADTFNENTPPSNDSLYLDSMAKRVYASLKVVDPKAKWIMQGWLFHFSPDFWHEQQIKALLNAVPENRMIVLDLWSENFPVWNQTKAYYGKPWIWCMLQNFGGNISMYGRMNSVAAGPPRVLKSSEKGKLVGMGLTPEAIEQNPVMYSLLLENVWERVPIDVSKWLSQYTHYRYGKEDSAVNAAWKILRQTVYNDGLTSGGSKSIITGRPTFEKNAGCTRTEKNYSPAHLVKAWNLMAGAINKMQGSESFNYDLVDLTRQVLANYADTLQQCFADAWRHKNLYMYKYYSNAFLELIGDMDRLLATELDFLLGRWLASARSWGMNREEKDLFEKNARNLITLWGNKTSTLHDYSSRQWSGLLNGFYKPRWKIFIKEAEQMLQEDKPLDKESIERKLKDWEWQWVNNHEKYASVVHGNVILETRSIYAKYKPLLERMYRLHENTDSEFSRFEMPLYDSGNIPGAKQTVQVQKNTKDARGYLYLTNVTQPKLNIWLPPSTKNTGTAVIICPGGGYGGISYTLEGSSIAEAFCSKGIAAIVLSYRLPSDESMENKAIGPLQDVQQAIKQVRVHAGQWGILVNKIGVAGFSAGGHLAAMAAVHASDDWVAHPGHISLRPDFSILVYPVISMTDSLTHLFSREHLLGLKPDEKQIKYFSAQMQVTLNTPPAFIVHTGDDPTVKVANSIRYYEALQHNGIPAELIIYPKGGHGFGLHNLQASDSWFDRCLSWMQSNGW